MYVPFNLSTRFLWNLGQMIKHEWEDIIERVRGGWACGGWSGLRTDCGSPMMGSKDEEELNNHEWNMNLLCRRTPTQGWAQRVTVTSVSRWIQDKTGSLPLDRNLATSSRSSSSATAGTATILGYVAHSLYLSTKRHVEKEIPRKIILRIIHKNGFSL